MIKFIFSRLTAIVCFFPEFTREMAWSSHVSAAAAGIGTVELPESLKNAISCGASYIWSRITNGSYQSAYVENWNNLYLAPDSFPNR